MSLFIDMQNQEQENRESIFWHLWSLKCWGHSKNLLGRFDASFYLQEYCPLTFPLACLLQSSMQKCLNFIFCPVKIGQLVKIFRPLQIGWSFQSYLKMFKSFIISILTDQLESFRFYIAVTSLIVPSSHQNWFRSQINVLLKMSEINRSVDIYCLVINSWIAIFTTFFCIVWSHGQHSPSQ